MNKKSTNFLTMIVVLAFLLRLIFIFVQIKFHIFDVNFFASDSSFYDGIAKNILAGNGFGYPEPTAYVTPLYPLFLSAVYMIFGHNILAVQLLQALIGSLSVLCVYFIAKKIFDEKIGSIAAIIMAFYPHQIFWSGYILTETLYVFLLLFAILFFIRFCERQTIVNALVAGILLGIAGLTRPIAFCFTAFLIIYIIWLNKNKVQGLKFSCIFVIGVLLVSSPWIIRNYNTFGEFIPGSTEGWFVFYAGNSPGATGGLDGYVTGYQDFTPLNFTSTSERNLSETEMNNEYKLSSLNFIKENPSSFFKIMPRKFWNMWRPNYAKASIKNHALMSLPYIIMIALALCGIYYSYQKHKNKLKWILYFFIAYNILFHLIFIGLIRYRLPVEPVLIIFAAYAISFHIHRSRRIESLLER
ncbi:MAG: glycosyltransferase family 39 protein [Euryarchaeota archaeon]|nr:glycosyltransferase family 39 protein [Euryarchaeota archaeon]MCG2734894.1 glycosyltransferase family 39 protein [Candidatus Methanoperedenaceae archaeon]